MSTETTLREAAAEFANLTRVVGDVAALHIPRTFYTSADNRAVYNHRATAKACECPEDSNCAAFGECDHVREIRRCTECDPIDPYATFVYGTYPCRTAEALEGAL